MDLVTSTMEQPTVVELTAPTMEEPTTTRLTSPGGGLHDNGNPSVEAWDAAVTSGGLGGVGTEPEGDVPSSAAQGSPAVAEQALSAMPPTAGEALGCSGRAR